MLKWCPYCQKFLGETEPYEDLRITHGVCAACLPNLHTLTNQDLEHSRRLQAIQDRLMTAGRSGDLKAADHIVKDAIAQNVRAIDILMGLVAPMLYQIGEEWRKGYITVAEEHRFTSYCEQIFEFLRNKVTVFKPTDPASADRVDVLLMNAPGNRHTLAIRILAAWFEDKGIPARVIDPIPAIDDLIRLICESHPRLVLVSIALSEQHSAVVRLAESVAALPGPHHPKILVGGYAVKMKLVPPIPGAYLVTDINSIETSLGNEHRGFGSLRNGLS
jgi:methanogenic corrinoid protein MtbC1